MKPSTTTERPPTVAAELFGSEDHHYMEEAKKLFPDFQDLMGRFLAERGYTHRPGETWRLRISGRKGTSSHHHQGEVKIRTIVEQQIEVIVQTGDRDTLRICRLIPPPSCDVNLVFSQLRDIIPQPQAEEMRKLTENIGMDVETIVRRTHDGSHSSALVHNLKSKALGERWSKPETVDRFCVELSAVREGNYVTDEALDRTTDKVNGRGHDTQRELVRAMTRIVLFEEGYISRNGKGFHLTDKLLAVIDVNEQKRGLSRPAELDHYVGTLLGIEREHNQRQTRLEQITSEEQRLVSEEESITARLHEIDQYKARLAEERTNLTTSSEDPIVQTGLQRLFELRRDLSIVG